MKAIKNRISNLIFNRDLFSIVYIVVCILWFFPLIGWIVNPISKLCFFWGILLIVYDIFMKRKFMNASYWYILVLMLFFYGISILINIKYDFYAGIKYAIYLSLYLLVLYVQDLEEKQIVSNILLINRIIIMLSFIAGTISLIMFLFQYELQFKQGETLLRQGFLENRLFGVYTSPNTGALFAIIAISLTILSSILKCGKIFQWTKFQKVNVVIQSVYFSLTLSKGGYLTLYVFYFLLICLFTFQRLQNKMSVKKAVIICGIYFLCSFGVINLGTKVLQKTMIQVAGGVQKIIIIQEEDSDKPVEKKKKVKFKRIETSGDSSNGRITIWKSGIKLWKQSPVFGITNAKKNKDEVKNWKYSLKSMNKEEQYWFYRCGGNMHNSYVQVLVLGGLACLISFLWFIVLCVKRYLMFIMKTNYNTSQYKIIASIICLLGAIGANGMVENHLVFNHQDPYGAIFWFYLGCGMFLIRKFERDGSCKKKIANNIENAFVCDTPLQLMNVINFINNDETVKSEKKDLYVINQFKNGKKIIENIRKEKVFSNVYEIEKIEYKIRLSSKMSTLYRLLFPKAYIKKATGQKKLNEYYNLMFSFKSPFVISMIRLYHAANMFLIEDGIGTYTCDMINDFSSTEFNIINKYFLESKGTPNIKRIYVNLPQMLDEREEIEVKKLSALRECDSTVDMLKRIFEYKSEKNSEFVDTLILTQPLNEVVGYDEKRESQVIESVKKEVLDEKLSVRIHPRQKQFNTQGIKVMDNPNMWELICLDTITDQTVLISAFSTTLCMPKIIADTEPTLIFLYKILFEDWKENTAVSGCSEFIDKFRELYSNKERIYIPDNLNELKAILKDVT